MVATNTIFILLITITIIRTHCQTFTNCTTTQQLDDLCYVNIKECSDSSCNQLTSNSLQYCSNTTIPCTTLCTDTSLNCDEDSLLSPISQSFTYSKISISCPDGATRLCTSSSITNSNISSLPHMNGDTNPTDDVCI